KYKTEIEIVDSVRELIGGSRYILNGLSIILSLFVLAASSFLNLQTFYQNSIFLLLIVLLGFLLYPLNKRGIDKHHPSIIDIGFIILALLGIGYIILNYNTLHVDRASHAKDRKSVV